MILITTATTVLTTYYMIITVLSILYKWNHFYISDSINIHTYHGSIDIMDLMDMFRYRYEYISLCLYIKLYAPMLLVSNFEARIIFQLSI